MKKLLLFNLIFSLLSCNSTDPLVLETHEVDFLNRTGDVIHGSFLDLEVAGGISISVFDTMMMVVTNNPEALLQVYDTRTLKPLAMLCQQGHAGNEFSDKNINKSNQVFLRDGDVIIVLRGEGGTVLKEINVSESIREGHTVVEGIKEGLTYDYTEVVGLDKGIDRLFVFNNHNYSVDNEDYNPPTFCIRNKDEIKEIKVYSQLVDFENKIYSTFWYGGRICYHPTRNIAVQCMNAMDYIHVFDMDNDKYFSIHQKGTPTFGDIIVPNKIEDDVYVYDFNHFSESIGTEKFFLVIYMNGDYRKGMMKQGNGEATELLAFDWDGNYLGGVKLDTFVHDLAFDSNTNLLYGLRIRDEKIVTFDLSEYIKSIGK